MLDAIALRFTYLTCDFRCISRVRPAAVVVLAGVAPILVDGRRLASSGTACRHRNLDIDRRLLGSLFGILLSSFRQSKCIRRHYAA